MKIENNKSLAPLTYFKIGGEAKYFADVKNTDNLKKAIIFAEEKSVKYAVISGGSNILISDSGYDGLVIKMNLKGLNIDGNIIVAESGVPVADVVRLSNENCLGGFEWAAGIPGRIGGSVYGNAGCYGKEIKDVVRSVHVFDVRTKEFIEMKENECNFSYRDSIFKHNHSLIIINASIVLEEGDKEKGKCLIAENIKDRQVSQDIGNKCAGCIFKNPKTGVSAGRLIERAGLKGKRAGGAYISEKHANFFINDGNAKSSDILKLIDIAKEKVLKKTGIYLEEEIVYLGDK